jgi:hypothetical protein
MGKNTPEGSVFNSLVMTCPAGHELRHIGTYTNANGGSYRLYGRSNGVDCALKDKCTKGKGRRLRVPNKDDGDHGHEAVSSFYTAQRSHPQKLRDELELRMEKEGDHLMQIRRQTVEPVNAQLKQHGLDRFHVRGLDRCSAVLTLACIAHNLMKWQTQEVTHMMKLVA